jgi:NADPH:quinone reductase-like Zn-dependent oxidoreductase
MKAAQITDYGQPDVFKIVEIDQPVPAANQVLIEIHASSINPIESKVRLGLMKDQIPLEFPVILGGDVAGTINQVGLDVTGFNAGDKVYGQASVLGGNSGAYAEFATTSAGQIAKMPANTNFTEAASLPLVGISALQALTEHLNLQSGQKIFIHGGAGGIGTVAIQIAKHLGAYVATSVHGDGTAYVKNLGADQIIDTTTEDFATELRDFDAVFDTVGGEDFVKTFSILKPGMTAVSMAAYGHEEAGKAAGITSLTQWTQVTTDRLNQLRELVEAGIITPHVDKVFSLNDIQQAFEAKESGTIVGKVVITIKE